MRGLRRRRARTGATALAVLVAASLPALVGGAGAPVLAAAGTEFAAGPVARIEAGEGDRAVFVPARRPLPPGAGTAAATATASFELVYGATVPEAAKPAIQYSVDLWSNLITSSVPVRLAVNYQALGAGALASAGSRYTRNFSGAPFANTWYPTAVADAITGTNLSGTNPDITIDISVRSDWYFGVDGRPPAGNYDLVSVVLHEVGHGLGLSGSMVVSGGAGSWGFGSPLSPSIYDRFAEDSAGARLIDTSVYTNGSNALGSALTSGAVYFDSTFTNRSNLDRPLLYAPATWSSGSSFSHLDEDAYPPGSANTLMTPRLYSAEAVHAPGPLALCMLEAVGLVSAQNCVPPATTNVTGFTWFSDGLAAKQGPTGTTLTAYGTGLARDSDYQLVTGLDGGPQHPCMWDVQPLNPAVRRSSNSGFVGNTRGTVDRGPGAWQVCLRQTGTAAALNVGYPRQFTVS